MLKKKKSENKDRPQPSKIKNKIHLLKRKSLTHDLCAEPKKRCSVSSGMIHVPTHAMWEYTFIQAHTCTQYCLGIKTCGTVVFHIPLIHTSADTFYKRVT